MPWLNNLPRKTKTHTDFPIDAYSLINVHKKKQEKRPTVTNWYATGRRRLARVTGGPTPRRRAAAAAASVIDRQQLDCNGLELPVTEQAAAAADHQVFGPERVGLGPSSSGYRGPASRYYDAGIVTDLE